MCHALNAVISRRKKKLVRIGKSFLKIFAILSGTIMLNLFARP